MPLLKRKLCLWCHEEPRKTGAGGFCGRKCKNAYQCDRRTQQGASVRGAWRKVAADALWEAGYLVYWLDARISQLRCSNWRHASVDWRALFYAVKDGVAVPVLVTRARYRNEALEAKDAIERVQVAEGELIAVVGSSSVCNIYQRTSTGWNLVGGLGG